MSATARRKLSTVESGQERPENEGASSRSAQLAVYSRNKPARHKPRAANVSLPKRRGRRTKTYKKIEPKREKKRRKRTILHQKINEKCSVAKIRVKLQC
jgi:hypothetical protein